MEQDRTQIKIQKLDFDWLAYYFKNPMNQEFLLYTDYYNDVLKGCKKILVIEDDLVSFNIIQSYIKDYNSDIKCFLAKNESDAIEILKIHGCELVISDYFLDSDSTGLQICQKIKNQFPDVECSIVSSLRHDQYQEILNYSDIEPNFFEKPISKQKMIRYLNKFYGED